MNPIDEWTASQQRVIELVEALSPDDAERIVPSCPDWTVRQLLSHMIGLDADVLAGNEPDDHNETWTAAQVEARAGDDIATLLDEWRAMTEPMQRWMAENNPRPMGDCVIHEQDLRGALDRPGARDTPAQRMLFETVAGIVFDKITAKELEPPRLQGDTYEFGPEGADVVVRGSDFDLMRLVISRRSADQLRAMAEGDIEPYVDCFGGFGPLRDSDLAE
ncbi:maleylpyruvate isomerase family mycothiol-dependent enzyme [Jatrophihabitans fulvus]